LRTCWHLKYISSESQCRLPVIIYKNSSAMYKELREMVATASLAVLME